MRIKHLRLSCLLSLALPGHAWATTYAVATVEPTAACHRSIRDAAVAGLLLAVSKSRKVEYGGAVLRRGDGCFVHSLPVTSNQPSRLDYAVRFDRRQMKLVAIYHTHTPGGYATTFSAADIAAQRRLGVPSYLGTPGPRRNTMMVRSLTHGGQDHRAANGGARTELVVLLEHIAATTPAIVSVRLDETE